MEAVDRRRLAAQVVTRLLAGVVLVVAVIILPAGTWAYWEAWVYAAVLFVPMSIAFVYLLRKDPELLERRMRTKEEHAEQSLIQWVGALLYVLIFVLPGFDRRFGWSDVPVWAVAVADLLVLAAYGSFFLVLRENSYASRVVEVEEGQKVITTGPYAIVRHPMYSAIIVMFGASPIALGSWWALLPAWLLVPLLVARILGEEQVLARDLEGYAEYMQVTKYRLLPGVW